MGRGNRLLAAAAILALLPAQGTAQWGMTAIGVAEWDTNETTVLLAGLSASPGGEGLSPLAGVQATYVTFDGGAGNDISVTTIRPYGGLRNGFDGGSMYAALGYAFQNRDDDLDAPVNVIGTAGDTNDGVTLSGGVEYWGTGGPLGAQALASYNFGGESLWTRGRVTTRLASLSNGGQVRLGGEVAYLTGDGYSVVQPGGMVAWHAGSNGLILVGGAGVKIQENVDNATYVKAELVLPIR